MSTETGHAAVDFPNADGFRYAAFSPSSSYNWGKLLTQPKPAGGAGFRMTPKVRGGEEMPDGA